MSDVTDAADRLESLGAVIPRFAEDIRVVVAAAVERDAVIKEMHARELHHFEEEERSAALAAVIEMLVENSTRVEGGPIPWVEVDASMWDHILDSDTAEILRERDAAVWTKCVEHLEVTLGQEVKRSAHLDNPYRNEGIR